MSALGIVQARMSSTRLPEKVLADLGGESMLALLLRRLARSQRLERVVVATSTGPEDDAIEEAAQALGFGVHRGPRDDVLTRFEGAADGHQGEVVRITGDCPLIDPGVVDRVVDLFRGGDGRVYAQNVEPRTFPDGLDVEVIDRPTLARLAAEVGDPRDREHVTSVLRRNPARWPQATLVADEDLGELRWTVDTEADLDWVRRVVERLGERRYEAGMEEIRSAICEEPSLAAVDEWRRG